MRASCSAARSPSRCPTSTAPTSSDARRQPVRVQRQPGHRPRLARAASRRSSPGAAGSSSSTPAAPAPPRRPTSTSPSAPAPTRSCSWRWSTCWRAEGLVDPGAGGRAPRRRRRGAGAGRPFTPEAVAPADRHRRRDDPPPGPRRWRRRPPRASTAASAPPRRSSARSRRGWSTCSTPSPATSTGPAGRCSPRPRPGPPTPAAPARSGGASRVHRRHSRVRGLPETLGELPVACLAEEIDTPGEGQVRALVTVAGNPVLSTPNSARLDAALGDARRLRRRRPLRQRDHPARRRDPARRRRRCRRATTTSPCCSWPCATWPTTARRCCRWTRASCAEWEILARLALVAQGMGADRRPRRGRRPGGERARRRGGRRRDRPAGRARPGRGHRPPSATARGPERLLDLMLRTGPYGDGFGADPDGLSLDGPRGQPARHRPRPARAPPARGAAHAERAWSSWRPSCSSPTSPACAPRSTRSPTAWCSSAGATCGPTTRGCTTSNVLVKGKPRCTLHVHPDDAARLGLVDGGAAEVPLAGRQGEVPVEVTDDIRPGVGQHPARLGPRPARRRAWRSPGATPG